jgi:hypothetical protein
VLVLALQVALAPALVAAATLAARRWSARTGGLVSAFPAIVGPVLLIDAHVHGGAFAARAASGTLLGLVALSGFALAYGRMARRTGWVVSLAAGWAVAGVLGLAVGALDARPGTGLVAAGVSLVLAHRLLPAPGSAAGAAVRAPRWDLPTRMALTAVLVVALAAAADRLGPVAGGVLAALPVLASVLAVFTHGRQGPDALAALLRGMLSGMAGFVAFCLLVAVLAGPAGVPAAFACAALAAVAAQALAATASRRPAGSPGPPAPGGPARSA